MLALNYRNGVTKGPQKENLHEPMAKQHCFSRRSIEPSLHQDFVVNIRLIKEKKSGQTGSYSDVRPETNYTCREVTSNSTVGKCRLTGKSAWQDTG